MQELVPFRDKNIPIQVTALQIMVWVGSHGRALTFGARKPVDVKDPINFQDLTDIAAGDIAIKTAAALTFTVDLTFDAQVGPGRTCKVVLLLSEFQFLEIIVLQCSVHGSLQK